ncbi:MAG: hypothetical protein ACKVT1_17485 [Dehalococcoidia bacterium]
MAKWIGLLVVVLAGVVAWPMAGGTGAAAASGAHAVDIVLENSGGHRVRMHFLVRARDDDEAAAAAVAAASRLMPDGAVVGRDGEVSAQFMVWGWTWDDAELPVAVSYNPAGAPLESEAAVQSALDTWSRVDGSRFRYAYAGQTDARPGTQDADYDGLNVVGWLDLGCGGGCVLGVTSKVDDVHEVDVVLNANPDARLGDGSGGTVDIETTLLHEAGHMASLEHSCQPFFGICTESESTAVMFFRYLGIHRSLGPDDVAGLRALYPQGASVASSSDGGLPLTGWSVDIRPGWTLTALPAGSIDGAMQSLHCVSAVYAMQPDGHWQTWVRGAAPALNTLALAEPGRAYWLYASRSCTASFTEPQS